MLPRPPRCLASSLGRSTNFISSSCARRRENGSTLSLERLSSEKRREICAGCCAPHKTRLSLSRLLLLLCLLLPLPVSGVSSRCRPVLEGNSHMPPLSLKVSRSQLRAFLSQTPTSPRSLPTFPPLSNAYPPSSTRLSLPSSLSSPISSSLSSPLARSSLSSSLPPSAVSFVSRPLLPSEAGSSRHSSSTSCASLPPALRKMASLQPGDGYGGEGFHRFPGVCTPQTASLVFMHGLGDTAAGWADLVSLLSSLSCFPALRVILPTAPVRPVTLNGGFPAPAWTDIFSLSKDAPEDKPGFLASKQRIDAILAGELAAGVAPERIILAGFSQGGALAYFTGLQASVRLGGIVALSTWTPLAQELRVSAGCLGKRDTQSRKEALQTREEEKTEEEKEEEKKEEKKEEKEKRVEGPTPVLHCHGEQDELVLIEFGQESAAIVRRQYAEAWGEDVAKKAVKFLSFQGLGHSANAQELDQVRRFIENVLTTN
ncbi:phospholipase/carboxylesterase [Toxoplasma gondii ME49]|uniref:Phospholipase/carboxylesterase n=1 Tax=Toxoplasma gondii (strain ATCC 50611 / Me49) TaxID=508771 RepID=S8EYA4_TOXGM|nr:phospholipase/carboxylesterase [Toxoplasma gondii ME49]EPT27302.1 phospholipase/carboxylesterase [Toxoplasma gondii ME49]|eukprot:XP_002366451.2 phospholipase/carboxylesterase [Toxoplasma gondii ME49]